MSMLHFVTARACSTIGIVTTAWSVMYALNRMIKVTTKISMTKGMRTMVTTKVTLPMATRMRIQVPTRSLTMASRIGLAIDMQTDVLSLYPHTHIGKRQLLWSFSAIMGNFFTT